jgi:lipoate-protein ligase A
VDSVICRLLPYEIADGYQNMAADEVMLESAVAGIAALRFYEWSTATLSLGYFQSESTRRASNLHSALPYVRRPTGGDTLIHHHELTYAFAIPNGPRGQRAGEKVSAWLGRMHMTIAAALAEFGVGVKLAQVSSGTSRRLGEQPLNNLCFTNVTPGDGLIAGHKVIGSAQRRQRGALLQHGAVLLKRSLHAPDLPGIYDLTAQRIPPHELADAIRRSWQHQIAPSMLGGDWLDSERQRREVLIRNKYTQPSWNEKR